MAITLTTLRGTPTYGRDASTGNTWLTGGVFAAPSVSSFDLPASGGTISIRLRTTAGGVLVACGNERGFWFGMMGGKAAFTLPGATSTSTAGPLNDGQWHTLTLHFDGTQGEFLVDGQRATMTSGANPFPFAGAFKWDAGTNGGTTVIGGFGGDKSYDWGDGIDSFSVTDAAGTVIYANAFNDPAYAPLPLAVTAGGAQQVQAGASVTLTSTATAGSGTYSYTWTQTAGTKVTLSSTTAASPTFTAPKTASELAFQVTASDGSTTASATTSVSVVKADTGTTPTTPTTGGDTGTTPGTSTSVGDAPADAFVQFKHLAGIKLGSGTSGSTTSAPASSKLTVVTMTGSMTYDAATLGASSSQVASVMFVQPAAGGAVATVAGTALNLNLAAGARTLVQIVPTGSGYSVIYPTTTLVAPYPPRPPLAPGCVRYKGPSKPADWLTSDTWEQTS